jgi:hypothetical protein
LVAAGQSDPRRGILLTQARWLAPAMDAWKLPELMTGTTEPGK